MTAHHRDRVHDPRHRLFIGVDIRRGYISIWSNDRCDLKSIAARQSLEFAFRKTLRITNYAALPAAIRNADGCTLPGHPRGQCFDLFERDVGVITNAAFCWTTRNVVSVSYTHLTLPTSDLV